MENVCLRRCSCRCFLKKEVPEEALLIPFSAEKGTGKTDLLAAISEICAR